MAWGIPRPDSLHPAPHAPACLCLCIHAPLHLHLYTATPHTPVQQHPCTACTPASLHSCATAFLQAPSLHPCIPAIVGRPLHPSARFTPAPDAPLRPDSHAPHASLHAHVYGRLHKSATLGCNHTHMKAPSPLFPRLSLSLVASLSRLPAISSHPVLSLSLSDTSDILEELRTAQSRSPVPSRIHICLIS